jgi:predicted RNase H-like HicB family nuclease
MATNLSPVTIQLSIIYETVENGWIQARIAELPEVITAAPTRAKAKDMVLDALREYLLSLTKRPEGDGEREPVALTITA